MELTKRRSPKTRHLICFACQQSAEKYLKGFLVEMNVRFSKTHALRRTLLPLCQSVDSEFGILEDELGVLDPHAVEFRYPGEKVEQSEVRAVVNAAKKVRRFVRGKLGLERQKRLL